MAGHATHLLVRASCQNRRNEPPFTSCSKERNDQEPRPICGPISIGLSSHSSLILFTVGNGIALLTIIVLSA
jgi:hypothetical protein